MENKREGLPSIKSATCEKLRECKILGSMRINSRGRISTIGFLVCVALCAATLDACSHSNSAENAPQSTTTEGKRYQLTGKVLSVAKEAGSANNDAAAIPGFMGAMAMPYPIPDEKALANLAPGDEITADVVVTGGGKYHLENIVVTKKGDGAAKSPSSQNLHEPAPGEKVPDFVLTNQDGKKFHLHSPKGGVTLVTFIYTRCPFPDYCPLVSRNFAQIYAATRLNPRVRLVSVSFDPKHDTPAVLRQYGNTFTQTTGRSPFDRWQFATAQPQELEKITNFFGLFYDPSQDQIVHSLSTGVITPDGTIYKWYAGGDWKPADLVNDATTVLAQESKTGPVSARAHLHDTKSSAWSQPGF
jgi:protein SCO1